MMFMSINSITSSLYDNYASGNYTSGKETSVYENSDPENSNENNSEVRELSKRDRKVRAHEAAHIAAGGQYVRGGATFEYETGPDGKSYAVGGEVSISVSSVNGDPEATIAKMEAVKRAALAPADPSSQDRAVAAAAAATEAHARQELAEQDSSTGSTSGSSTTGPANSDASGSGKIYSYDKKGSAITSSSLYTGNLLATA
jgi:hypothetical protein